ncbi:hypothetical protein G9A89_010571 [Geosiphon pyriformis]|nr:hypothetical protein G9A89_010571 [Geosiphon pyriformis]
MVKKTRSSEKWEQLLASAIVTPNPFVVPNKILDEIFIKLAHVKAVFQSVHGFLGAKSVSKDNVKLFCVEFVFQQSLEAAFLVELTSSVRLATFKIAKSLVVSKFGSSPAAVALHDVPLGVSAANIKLALSVFSSVTRVVLKPAGIWQYVVIYFEKLNSAVSALKHWSVLMSKDSIRILFLVNQNEIILSHDKFKTKLVNLPPGCTTFEISDIISQIGGQTCFIPCSPNSGCRFWFALVTFDSQDNLDSAVVKTGHLAVDCKISPSPTPKVPKIFKSYFVGGVSYAKASASLDSFEFPPLAASTSLFMVVGDSLVSSQLASLESNMVKLSTLVESIVKPVGFLVKLFEQFVNRDLVSSSKLGLKVNEVMVHMDFFNKMVGKLGKEVVSLKKECCMEDIDMSGDSKLLVGMNDKMFSNLLSLWEHEPIDVKANALKTAE